MEPLGLMQPVQGMGAAATRLAEQLQQHHRPI
jgi:hypothetical protein